MKEKLEQIKAEALKQIQDSNALDKLNEIRISYLGKKGELTAVLKSMKDLAAEERSEERQSDKAGDRSCPGGGNGKDGAGRLRGQAQK